MKRLISILTVAVVCITLSYKSFAQTPSFAGTVKFEIKYQGDIDPQNHIPFETTCIIFENKTKESFYGGAQNQIHDGDALTITVLLDLPGYGRIGRITPKEAVEEMLSLKNFSYEERADTKNICGYVCKGYNVTVVTEDEDGETKETKMIVYTTKEIGKDENINAFKFPELSGYPLYIETESDGVKEITQAKEVKKGKIRAVDFLVPSDYKIRTSEEEWALEMMRYYRHIERIRKE